MIGCPEYFLYHGKLGFGGRLIRYKYNSFFLYLYKYTRKINYIKTFIRKKVTLIFVFLSTSTLSSSLQFLTGSFLLHSCKHLQYSPTQLHYSYRDKDCCHIKQEVKNYKCSYRLSLEAFQFAFVPRSGMNKLVCNTWPRPAILVTKRLPNKVAIIWQLSYLARYICLALPNFIISHFIMQFIIRVQGGHNLCSYHLLECILKKGCEE